MQKLSLSLSARFEVDGGEVIYIPSLITFSLITHVTLAGA
jgi:hypothetical protein